MTTTGFANRLDVESHTCPTLQSKSPGLKARCT